MSEKEATKWQPLAEGGGESCGQHEFPLGAGRYARCGSPATWGRRNGKDEKEFACDGHVASSFPYSEDELITRSRIHATGRRYGVIDGKNGRTEPPNGPPVEHQDAYLEGWWEGHIIGAQAHGL